MARPARPTLAAGDELEVTVRIRIKYVEGPGEYEPHEVAAVLAEVLELDTGTVYLRALGQASEAATTFAVVGVARAGDAYAPVGGQR